MRKFTNEIYAYALENAFIYGSAMESAVLPKLFQHGLQKNQIKEVMPEIKKIIKEINSNSEEKKILLFEDYKKFLKEKPEQEKGIKELLNVKGRPVFRIAPFPSGAIHIGNTRTFLLNAIYAKKYNGKLLFIIDDTIGSEEKSIIPEAYSLITESFNWLGIKYKEPIIYKSDRLKIYYKYAEEIINKGKAYVCSCSQEQLRENRLKQQECGCRQLPVKLQLERWKKMFDAKQGQYTLRLKTSMQHPNPAFRDRVLFRISERVHPRVGRKYKIWPMLEFSWAIDDHLLGVTHIIRGKELMIEGEMQKYIWDIFGWKHPELIYSGLVKFEGLDGKLSKSKSQKEVRSGEYIGWDDPRTWSVQSLKRRGILPESIIEFVEKMGLSQKESIVPIDDLYAINRQKLDKTADRYSFVEDPVKLEIKIHPKLKSVKIKIHPEKNKTKIVKIGKEIFISLSDFSKFKSKEIRLMHLYNVFLSDTPQFTSLENKNIQKIQWVSESVKTKIFMPDGVYKFGLAEKNIKKLKIGKIIQFERVGFCRFDNFNKKTGEYEFWFAHG